VVSEWPHCRYLPEILTRTTAFLANVFNPTGADSLFTISNLLITSVFPARTQALAGGVFNTISQIGKAVGLALVAVIASSVTNNSKNLDKGSKQALMEGYRATFWYSFACIVVTILLCLWGLQRIGKVGHKRD
jgi:MFS family permease